MKKIKILIFGIVLMSLFFAWNNLFVPNELFYGKSDEKDTKLDYILLGSSNVFDNFSPLEVWNESGYAGYDVGNGNQPVSLAYFQLQESIEDYSPKVVFFDCFAFAMGYGYDSFNHLGIDPYPLTLNKINFLKEVEYNDKGLYWMPFLQWHVRWDQISKYDFTKEKNSPNLDFMGYYPIYNIEPCDYKLLHEDGQPALIDPASLEYFHKIVKLCDENNIDLVMIKTPNYVWSKELNEATQSVADQYGLKFIDFNEEQNFNQLGIDMSKDFRDKGHFNDTGARKASRWLANYIKENYDFEDKRNLESYASWNEKYEKYQRHGKIISICMEDNYEEYIQSLKDEGSLKIITIKTKAIDDIVEDEMFFQEEYISTEVANSILEDLGISTRLTPGVDNFYTAIIDGNNVVFEDLQSIAISNTYEYNGHEIFMESTNNYQKDFSKIQIDYVNYSLNATGVNIVVFDKLYDEVIDRTCLNYWENNFNISR